MISLHCLSAFSMCAHVFRCDSKSRFHACFLHKSRPKVPQIRVHARMYLDLLNHAGCQIDLLFAEVRYLAQRESYCIFLNDVWQNI